MRYVALLRGINVAAHNRIAMADLKLACEAAGYLNVATYLQSGNIAFEAGDVMELELEISDLILQRFNLTISVIIRAQTELRQMVAEHPEVADPNAWYITFLGQAPSTEVVASLDPLMSAPDKWFVLRRDVYLNIAGNYSDSKLTNAWFEAKFDTIATTRNWKTVQALAEL